MSSIFQKPKVRPNLGHNGFDLSRRRLFTSPCGMLLPIFWDFASPGEQYKLNSSIFVRTEAIATAAMMRLKAHVDWFFVPITQMYSLWNEFFNGTDDNMSSIFSRQDYNNNGIVSQSLPYFDCTNVVLSPYSFGFKFLVNPPAAVTPDLKLQPKTDECGVPYLYNFRRMWDMLGYGSLTNVGSAWSSAKTKRLSLLPYLAYHKIFHSHFMQNDWFLNNPNMYNVDQFYTTGVIDNHTALDIMSNIHYRPYRTDYFTNILPSPTFSKLFPNNINGSLLNGTNLNSVLNSEGSRGNVTTNASADSQSIYAGAGSSISITDKNLSVGDIRGAFALDKLLRITAFGGSHYEDQTLAHFGFKIPQGISKEAYRLGSQEADISINEVVATATTDASVAGGLIGDIAGKGFASSNGGKSSSFTAPCHGILMAIYSIEPIPEYSSIVEERKNFYREPFDFYHPELDNVGMQPFDTPLLYNGNGSSADNMSGWTYRYAELKSNFDVVNESLWDTSRAAWQGNKQMPYLKTVAGSNVKMSKFNLFYIIPQYTNSIFQYPFKSYENLPDDQKWHSSNKINDWSANDLTSTNCYSGDNFINNVDIQCFKVSPMSVHSLPKIY